MTTISMIRTTQISKRGNRERPLWKAVMQQNNTTWRINLLKNKTININQNKNKQIKKNRIVL